MTPTEFEIRAMDSFIRAGMLGDWIRDYQMIRERGYVIHTPDFFVLGYIYEDAWVVYWADANPQTTNPGDLQRILFSLIDSGALPWRDWLMFTRGASRKDKRVRAIPIERARRLFIYEPQNSCSMERGN